MKMNSIYICKGKRKDNNEWVEGYLYITHNGEYEIKKYDEVSNIEGVTYEVIPKTVRRCTGLTDKNGKLIFEGDIIRTKKYGRVIAHSTVSDYDIFRITYVPAVFRLENIHRAFNLVGNSVDYEVIGNICDNPELLEVQNG